MNCLDLMLFVLLPNLQFTDEISSKHTHLFQIRGKDTTFLSQIRGNSVKVCCKSGARRCLGISLEESAQADMAVLKDIANIYPRMTSFHDSSLFDNSFAMDFINYGDKIIYCAMYLYVGYINEATNFAESHGGGGGDTKDWGREKDEDEIEWIRRCLRQATRIVKPRKGKGLSR